PGSLEKALFAAAADRPGMAWISLTRARPLGFDDEGRMRLAPEGREQISVFRDRLDADTALSTAWVRREGGSFAAFVRRREPGEGLTASRFVRATLPVVKDPTSDLTFVTPASRPFVDQARAVWSDLSHVQADEHLPENERRVVLSAMRALKDRE